MNHFLTHEVGQSFSAQGAQPHVIIWAEASHSAAAEADTGLVSSECDVVSQRTLAAARASAIQRARRACRRAMRNDVLVSISETLRTTWRDAVINGLVASPLVPRPLRWRILRFLGMSIESSAISGRIFFGGTKVSIGRGTFINYGAFIDNGAPVTIGSRVRIAPRVMLITGTHEIGNHEQRAGADVAAPVTIGDGAWIGAGAVILPGVTIGEGTVIGAGAVVTSDCAADSIYAGVPAKLVRTLSDHLAPHQV